MSGLFEVTTFWAVMNDSHFGVAAFLYELRRNLCPCDVRRTDFGRGTVIYEKDFIERYLCACAAYTLDLLDIQDAVLSDNVLLASCLNNCDFSHIL